MLEVTQNWMVQLPVGYGVDTAAVGGVWRRILWIPAAPEGGHCQCLCGFLPLPSAGSETMVQEEKEEEEGCSQPELGEQHPWDCGSWGVASMARGLGDEGGCRVGTRHPLHELQLLFREHPAGACAPVRRGTARRWSGSGDEPRDFPGAAVPGGGELGTESL